MRTRLVGDQLSVTESRRSNDIGRVAKWFVRPVTWRKSHFGPSLLPTAVVLSRLG